MTINAIIDFFFTIVRSPMRHNVDRITSLASLLRVRTSLIGMAVSEISGEKNEREVPSVDREGKSRIVTV